MWETHGLESQPLFTLYGPDVTMSAEGLVDQQWPHGRVLLTRLGELLYDIFSKQDMGTRTTQRQEEWGGYNKTICGDRANKTRKMEAKGKENTGGAGKWSSRSMLSKYGPSERCSECTRSPLSPSTACNLRQQHTSIADTRHFYFESPSLVNHSSLPLVPTSRRVSILRPGFKRALVKCTCNSVREPPLGPSFVVVTVRGAKNSDPCEFSSWHREKPLRLAVKTAPLQVLTRGAWYYAICADGCRRSGRAYHYLTGGLRRQQQSRPDASVKLSLQFRFQSISCSSCIVMSAVRLLCRQVRTDLNWTARMIGLFWIGPLSHLQPQEPISCEMT